MSMLPEPFGLGGRVPSTLLAEMGEGTMSMNGMGVAYVAPVNVDPWQASGEADAFTTAVVKSLTTSHTVNRTVEATVREMVKRLNRRQRQRIYDATRNVERGAFIRAIIARQNARDPR